MRNFTGVPNNPLGECIYTLYKLCHDKTTSSEFRVLFLSFFYNSTSKQLEMYV